MMSDHQPAPQKPPVSHAHEEIDLRQLAHVVWRHRITIVLMSVLGALLAAGAHLLLAQYESRGLFLTPGVAVDAHKRYEAALDNRSRLEQFLDLSGNADSPAADVIRKVMESGTFSEAARPVFAFTEKDAKAFGVKVEDANKLVGMELSLRRKTPEGVAPVQVLAEYVRDAMIKVDLEDFVLDQCLANEIRDRELRNEHIRNEFEIAQERLRAENLRRIMAATPGAQNIENRQVVSLENGGERFLSPAAQLVAAEITISDLALEEQERGRQRVSAQLRKEYYCRANAALAAPITGRKLLDELDKIRAEVFATRDMTSDVVEETENALAIQSQKWRNQYLHGMRFVNSPEAGEVMVRRAGMPLVVVLGAVLGFLFGVLLAIVFAWWRDNREAVLARDDVG
jgi:LPS O-antigen subunit length determinant protein (WzzB/FepE family)